MLDGFLGGLVERCIAGRSFNSDGVDVAGSRHHHPQLDRSFFAHPARQRRVFGYGVMQIGGAKRRGRRWRRLCRGIGWRGRPRWRHSLPGGNCWLRFYGGRVRASPLGRLHDLWGCDGGGRCQGLVLLRRGLKRVGQVLSSAAFVLNRARPCWGLGWRVHGPAFCRRRGGRRGRLRCERAGGQNLYEQWRSTRRWRT